MPSTVKSHLLYRSKLHAPWHTERFRNDSVCSLSATTCATALLAALDQKFMSRFVRSVFTPSRPRQNQQEPGLTFFSKPHGREERSQQCRRGLGPVTTSLVTRRIAVVVERLHPENLLFVTVVRVVAYSNYNYRMGASVFPYAVSITTFGKPDSKSPPLHRVATGTQRVVQQSVHRLSRGKGVKELCEMSQGAPQCACDEKMLGLETQNKPNFYLTQRDVFSL